MEVLDKVYFDKTKEEILEDIDDRLCDLCWLDDGMIEGYIQIQIKSVEGVIAYD